MYSQRGSGLDGMVGATGNDVRLGCSYKKVWWGVSADWDGDIQSTKIFIKQISYVDPPSWRRISSDYNQLK